eukprot:271289_1
MLCCYGKRYSWSLFCPELLQVVLYNTSLVVDDKQHIQSNDVPKCITCSVNSRCSSFDTFAELIQETSDVKSMVNCFLHLFHHHQDNESFEYIGKMFGGYCDASKCARFNRHYRNRSKEILVPDFVQQIIDKLHCYYLHSYDLGMMLNTTDKKIISDGFSDSKNEEKISSLCFVNKTLIKKHKLLDTKLKKYCKLRNNKYNQLSPRQYDGYFCNGERFKYGESDQLFELTDEYDDTYTIMHGSSVQQIEISSKYISLKSELLYNHVSNINIQQWNEEYRKCQIHFSSWYKKKHYSTLPLEFMLSLMFYCNYTELQYHFSKTYREQTVKHRNFFHLGKYLKMSINFFGTSISDGSIRKFYHGISDQLIFIPSYKNSYISKVYSYGPISTSSSMEVAINFTNFNNGMVAEFTGSGAKYFSLSWISDYPNELEHLFIQNQSPLHLINIQDCKLGYEYGLILKILGYINYCTIHKNTKNYLKCYVSQNDTAQVLMKAIIDNQLSRNFAKYQEFQSLSGYARKLIDDNLNMIYETHIHYNKYEIIWSAIFYRTDYEWIQLDLLNCLLPKLELLVVRDINLSKHAIIDLFSYLRNKRIYYALKKIIIWPKMDSVLSAHHATQRYSKLFTEIGFHMKTLKPPNSKYTTNTYQDLLFFEATETNTVSTRVKLKNL